MTNDLQTFDPLLQNGYRFEPLRYVREGIALFQQFAGGFILFTLAVLIALRIAEELPNLLAVAVQLALAVCWAGYMWVCRLLSQGQKPELSDFLHGFRHPKYLL